MLSVGEKIPNFKMSASGGKTVRMSDFVGKKLVLYFYPKDDTPGCTKEAIDFTQRAAEFERAGAAVLGVSKDTVSKHEKFSTKHELSVTLASDADGTFCEEVGVWVEKKMYGRTFMGIERATFLVDRTGEIVRVWEKVKVPGHADDVLQVVKKT